MEFNYQKAYCCLALPAFNALNERQKAAQGMVANLTADLTQDRQLNIPMTETVREVLNILYSKELAELSRANYFVGHWRPSLLSAPFDNANGQSWKVANCCDQILRERLSPPHNIQIHEGKLRVTYSDKNNRLCAEFGLATPKNLEIFENCSLPFGLDTLNKSAEKLRALCGDLWPDVETVPYNELYADYLEKHRAEQLSRIDKKQIDRLRSIEKYIEDSYKEKAFLGYCICHDIPISNVIYYSHTDVFCFGRRNPGEISETEKERIQSVFARCPEKYNIEFR